MYTQGAFKLVAGCTLNIPLCFIIWESLILQTAINKRIQHVWTKEICDEESSIIYNTPGGH